MSLMLDSRQRAMLAEMGVKVWMPAHAPDQVALVEPAPVAAQPLTPLAALQQAVAADARPAAVAQMPTVQALPSAALMSTHAADQVDAVSVDDPINIIEKSKIPKNISPVRVPPPAAVPVALTGPVASMDWAELRAAVSSCQACDLCESRRQTVFGVGAQRADWMVIGEAPGEQEDLRGEPFVGPAGQLLDAMLRAAGVSRLAVQPDPSAPVDQTAEPAPATPAEQAAFIANVLKCRPPGNRNPLPAEIAQCQPYLRRQVALVQPKIILALGRFAVQALLNTTEPIGRLRQQVHSYEGVPVIVSYHPAYLLRNLPEKAKAWADLVLAMQVAQSATR